MGPSLCINVSPMYDVMRMLDYAPTAIKSIGRPQGEKCTVGLEGECPSA